MRASKKSKRVGLLLVLTLLFTLFQNINVAQAISFNVNDFNLAGSAKNCGTALDCAAVPVNYDSTSPTSTSINGEVQLTAASGSQGGFAWSKQRISLESNFDIQAQLYLGSNDGGADGLAFVLQPVNTSAGSSGGGIGYLGIAQPCFAVEFDTYRNADIANDHAALMRCSSTDAHNYFTSGATVTTSTTTGSVDLNNIEDGYWRNVQFTWTAPITRTGAGTFVVKFDRNHNNVYDSGDTLFSTSINFYNFFGDSNVGSVYWGFTAATGGANNVQAVRGIDYVVASRTNAAPTIASAPTNDTVNSGPGTFTKTFSMQDDATTTGQWTFTTTSSNAGRVSTTSTSATSATSATTSYTLLGSSGSTTITINAFDADGASVTTSFTVAPLPGLNPTFSTYTRTADGFTVQISNYSADYSWAGTATAGGTVSINGSGLATITGVAPNTSSVATITTRRTGYTDGSTASTATTSLSAQTVTWSPTTAIRVQQSPLTPSSLATALDTATITYSVTSAGITGCSVASNTGVLTYNAPGVCVVRASAAATASYAAATRDVTFTITSISLQPTNDTTTAGLTDSFTITTVAAPAGLTRVIKWQVATDTVTAAASVSWIDITSGSGSTNGSGFTTETFTTAALTTAMNEFRYRAIVTFTGSGATAGITSVETSTVATLTINPAITITSSTSTITKKYGAGSETRTVTFTGGTDTRTVSASSLSLANGKITFDTSTARFTIDTRTAVGTWLDTITITDAKGATASYVQTIIFTVADTLTVTSDTPTALTYTGSEAVFTPTVSVVSGLVTGDVISGATYNYSASTASCAAGGTCSIGQTGPGGGLVFITPSTTGNTTGKYFEAAPSGWSGTAADPSARLCTSATSVAGAAGTAIGTGETNTTLFANSAACGASAADTATALVLGGKDDWFLPSFDELKEMFSKLHKAAGGALGGFNTSGTVDYLSSSDNPSGPYTPSGTGYALYGWFGSSDGVIGWGSTSKTNPFAYRPVRSFVATSTSTVNYGPSTTKPTDASTYTITPSVLTFSDGAESNYAAITYQSSTLTINKAAQAALSVVPLYLPFNGNPTSATLLSTGGSDNGAVSYAYVSSLSTAGGCALSGADSSTVTVTSDGTCRIVATKAATNNYLIAISDTGTVTFHLYVTNIPAPRAAEYPAEIVLSGATAMTSNGLAPTITTTGTDFTAAPGATFTIAGSGFVGTRLVRVSGTSAAFTVISDTSLQITMPSGLNGISGPIYVEKAEGSRVSEDWVTGTA